MSSSSSHLMKTTRRGRPFVKDTHDLFATLVVSLQLDTHRSFFKSYPNSFTTDEACNNLASLKFSQSNRAADPKDPSRIITTTTTTTFSMTRDMAKGICQHFMDAQLIENAADLSSPVFRERGVYMLTPKGLHILERFITKNGISAEHLLKVFATQPICMKLLHLERRTQDDEILVTKSVIEVLFRRFVGREPNATRLSDDELVAQYQSRPHAKAPPLPSGEDLDRTLGIVVRKVSGSAKTDEYHFAAMAAVQWLCDFTTIVGTDEGAEIAAHFVRYGLISLVSDRGKVKDYNLVTQVRAGGPGGGAGAMMQEAEFRATDKAVYRVTKEGMQVARWELGGKPASAPAKPVASKARPSQSTDDLPGTNRSNPTGSIAQATDHGLMRRPSVSDRMRAEYIQDDGHAHSVKDSHTARLKQILEEPALRSLFREFLRANFCEENLSFWLDVQDFKRRFSTTSSAVASPGQQAKGRTTGHLAMEKHQQDLIAMAFVIYNTYLAPASPCELNIDHQLRAELITYMTSITADKDAGLKAVTEPGIGNTLHASQLQTMVKLYERIQGYMFRLMATDSVPKFCKTDRFLNLMRSVFDYNDKFTDDGAGLAAQTQNMSLSPSAKQAALDDDASSRAYLTISQAANEKQAALQKAA
ncbi:hypothetical protein Q5752_003546 [Cryptotrichosporon argae]